jgi:dihydroorotate dehydrogenase
MIPMANAAGQVKLPHEVEPLLAVPADILPSVTLGSYTLEKRDGNPGKTYWSDRSGAPTSINALGLPNPGIDEARTFLRDDIRRIRESGKRARISIAGFGISDYAELLRISVGLAPDEIEVNLGCPNVRVDGEQKPIFAFDLEELDAVLSLTHRRSGSLGEPDIAIKLSPYSDPFFLAEVAEVLKARLHGYEKLVLSNTFPNASGFDGVSKPVMGPATDGYGGLAGRAMKHIALGQVRQFRKHLPKTPLIGVGGISSGIDLLDMQLAGANEVQVGTAYFERGARIFPAIVAEYAEIPSEYTA